MTAIDEEMRQRIHARLAQIEAEEAVRVLFACESGSRAWGFPSDDSDYDVRFIYIRHRDWYLSIDLERRRDVIERPIIDRLDLSGWDLRKALGLLRKSNPPLLEWLVSPIIYVDAGGLAARLRTLADHYYSPAACTHHYLHMARGNIREYLKGELVWIKKYFYVLRPLLAIRWLESHEGRVPMNFLTLLEGVRVDAPVRARIDELLARKAAGVEMDRGPMIPEISAFIESEMARLEHYGPDYVPPPDSGDALNQLFREVVLTSRQGDRGAGPGTSGDFDAADHHHHP